MNRCWNLTREATHYRHAAFDAGLHAAGYAVQKGQPNNVRPGDVVLSWHRYSDGHRICAQVEQAGGIALIAENGYIGKGGLSPHSMQNRDPYALSRSFHNDDTVLPDGDGSRWDALGIELQPWRTDGKHILIMPNRSFGTPGRVMPPDWGERTAERLRTMTKREIRIRPHPRNDPPKKPLAEDLAGAHCCVIWSSSAGVHALVAGVPVICTSQFWVCKSATGSLEQIENPPMPDRLPALHRLAFGQFFLREIESGYAISSVLHSRKQTEIAACA